jgi:hypothetical protein
MLTRVRVYMNVIKICTSVISTLTRLISHAKYDSHAECDFTRKVWFPHTRDNFDTYANECDTHECDNDTH